MICGNVISETEVSLITDRGNQTAIRDKTRMKEIEEKCEKTIDIEGKVVFML